MVIIISTDRLTAYKVLKKRRLTVNGKTLDLI